MSRTIQLQKGRELFVVAYETGEEAIALEHLIGMVRDPATNFDWFDAALLSNQLSRHLGAEMKQYLPKGAK